MACGNAVAVRDFAGDADGRVESLFAVCRMNFSFGGEKAAWNHRGVWWKVGAGASGWSRHASA